jgi:hypothetical protein
MTPKDLDKESQQNIGMRHHRFLLSEINSLSALEEDWDGDGGLALFPAIAHQAKAFLSALGGNYTKRISDIFINPHGTITIEWINNLKEKLSIELGVNGYSYFLRQFNNQPVLTDGAEAFPDIQTFQTELDKIILTAAGQG